MEPNGLNIEGLEGQGGIDPCDRVGWGSVWDGEGLEVEEGVDWEGRDRKRQKCLLSLVTSLSQACSPLCLARCT